MQSNPDQLEHSNAGRLSLFLSCQESLAAPATEQMQGRSVLIIPAFVHPDGLTLHVHLPEMVTCLYAHTTQSIRRMS